MYKENNFTAELVTIAKELKQRGLSYNAIVVLGEEVPFKRFGVEASKLTAYIKRSDIYNFIFDEEYSIVIENVFCFPQ